jgi:eukaryotic-like serine/threonine-protein kinase
MGGSPDWRQVDALFTELLDIPEPDRAGRLTARCGEDLALREAVERLLAAEKRAASVFGSAAESVNQLVHAALRDDAADDSVPESLRRLGPYRLLRLLGRGGMSSVWLAERDDGEFQRQVAIKLLRQWIDGEAGVRRFVAERQILSSLAHPNIVPLLDGGTTPDGTPWLATEYVEGATITAHCESRQLDVAARLALFLQVADAVHHAHQKLVVHRDLKPSNIMVDEPGRVRLLDFGIAKLLDPASLPGAMPLTRTAYRPMTPEYAAPEQAAGGAITTATDVYQLGILLCELLTGERPGRSTDRTRKLRGDLDVIVQKATQQDPAQRYLSAAALADDIRRHLEGRAIAARPESGLEAMARFFRRRPWAAVALALAIGLGVTAQVSAIRYSQQRDAAQREAARAQQVKDVLLGIFRQADPGAGDALRGRETTVWDYARAAAARARAELAADPGLLAELLATLAMLQHYSGDMSEGAALLEEAVQLHRAHDGPQSASYAVALAELGRHWSKLNRLDEAAAAVAEAVAAAGKLPDEQQSAAVAVLVDAGDVYRTLGRLNDAASAYREARELLDEGAWTSLDTQLAINNGLAEVLIALDEHVEAGALASELIARIELELGPGHARLIAPLSALGQVQRRLGQPEEAVRSFERGLRLLEREYGPGYESTRNMRNNLILALAAAGEHARAVSEMRVLIGQRRELGGDGDLEVANSLQNLGVMLVLAGEPEEALATLQQASASYALALPPVHLRHAFPLLTQAYIWLRLDSPHAAEPLAMRAEEILLETLPAGHYAVGVARCLAGEAQLATGRRDEAMERLSAGVQAVAASPAGLLPYADYCRAAYDSALAVTP